MSDAMRWIASRLNWGGVDPSAVRAEVWALGGRYQGQVVEGAGREMRAIDLPPQRRRLLKAVIRSERAKGRVAR